MGAMRHEKGLGKVGLSAMFNHSVTTIQDQSLIGQTFVEGVGKAGSASERVIANCHGSADMIHPGSAYSIHPNRSINS